MTLVELLVVIAIIATFAGLVLPAVQSARMSALQTRSRNQLRQIVLATHAYGQTHGGVIADPKDGRTIFSCIMSHFDGLSCRTRQEELSGKPYTIVIGVRNFESPADPSLTSGLEAESKALEGGNCSYASNALLFVGVRTSLDSSFSDGLAATMMFCEHYARCREPASAIPPRYSDFVFNLAQSSGGSLRRPTFADAFYGDVTPALALGGTERRAFQLVPALRSCDPAQPQSPHAGGMLAGFADGSVRTVSASINASVFWASATPSGGENCSVE